MKKIIIIGSLLFLASCGVTSKSVKVSVGEYTANIDVYTASDAKKQNTNIAFIVLHPKTSKGRSHSGVVDIAQSLSGAGYTVYAPDMPYSDYSGTLTDSFKLIDELARRASQGNKQVIITGHSIGGAVALLYACAYKPNENVAGIVLMAPGHLLQVSMRMQEVTAVSVQRARKQLKNGKADVVDSFYDFNQGKKVSISTTPRIYVSYFDPREFPNPATSLESLKVPLLWIDGEHDVAAARMGYEALYDRAYKYPQNKYMLVSAGHFDAPSQSSGPILEWIKQFE